MTHHNTASKHSIKKLIVALFVSAISLTLAAPAFAGPFVDVVPSQVEYSETPVLLLSANNIIYKAQLPAPGCGYPANTVDTLKTWTNLSQAALLSGKTIRIYFDVCASTNFIRDIVLKR